MNLNRRDLAAKTRETFGQAAEATGDRMIQFTFATSDVARDNHRILPGAWESKGHDGLAEFRANPVFLFCHKDDTPPIGRVVTIAERGGQLRGAVQFPTSDQFEFGATIYELFRGGFMNACSVGWLPVEYAPARDASRPGGIEFRKVTLLEVSAVGVPADPGALATARSRGINTQPLAQWAARRLDEKDFARVSKHDLEVIERAARADAAKRKLFAVAAPAADSFRTLGEYLGAVARAVSDTPSPIDQRLIRAPSGATETDPPRGGFAVPSQWLDEVVGSIYAESALGSLIDKRETDRPLADVKLPAIHETTRADGGRLGGVVSYWLSEGMQPPSSFPRFRLNQFSGHKLAAVMIATNELVADAPLLEATFREVVASELGFRLDQMVIAGTGAGQPLGVTAAPATITVAKVNGQAPGSIVQDNLSAMWARLPGPLRRRAVWVGNSDVETQLDNGEFSGLYSPSGADGDTTPRIKGRPLLVSEASPTLGSVGDLILIDPRSYLLLSNPVRFAMSVHAKWLSDECIFRVVWRVDGKPKFASAITPANNGATQSPFITLAAR